jgi:hypothetical protein
MRHNLSVRFSLATIEEEQLAHRRLYNSSSSPSKEALFLLIKITRKYHFHTPCYLPSSKLTNVSLSLSTTTVCRIYFSELTDPRLFIQAI